MAIKYPKKRSPFWYIQYVDKDGVRRNQSSGLHCNDPRETAEADILVAKLTKEEISRGMHGAEPTPGWDYVLKYLRDRCKNNDTHKGYVNRWEWINLFLSEKKVRAPENVTFAHGQEYVDWRTAYKKKSGRSVCKNTAIMEVKLFSQIMQQAVRLNLCPANPLVKLGLKKDDPDEKPEITDEEFAIILPALENEPEWMKVSWQIAMHTGCRLKDTRLPVDQLDFEGNRITFEKPKGGKKRAFSVPMPKALRPLLESLCDGRKSTLEFPFQPSRQWQHFFRRVGLPHLTFHCTRVTFVTRLARRGVPLSAAMRLVNHASTTIHRIYQRLNVEDVRQYADLVFQDDPAATAQSPKGTPCPKRKESQAAAASPKPRRIQPPRRRPSL